MYSVFYGVFLIGKARWLIPQGLMNISDVLTNLDELIIMQFHKETPQD